MADAAADRFDRSALAGYFEQVLSDPKIDRERATVALYGLAALRRPVLPQVQALLAEKDLTLSEQMHLALALSALGDLEGARPVFRSAWGAHGERLGSNARLNAGRDQDEIVAATAQAAVLAARLGEPEAAGLVGYLLENWPKEMLVLLEHVLIAQAVLPNLQSEPAAFTYVEGGQEKRVELKPGETVRWQVPATVLSTLRFTAVQGQVGVSAAYEAPLGAAELRQEPGFSVSRTYSVDGKTATSWQQGDLVKVTLTYRIPEQAPAGSYELTDYLPSGLRRVERPWQHGMSFNDGRSGEWPAWPLETSGQRVSFWAWRDQKPVTLHYYARVVSPGQYTAEQPVLQHQNSGIIYAHGDRAQVEIGE